MRSSRLLALLLVLQRRGRATAQQLADELHVSVRTLYRDVAALGEAGVPVWTEPGPRGGVRLVEGWRTQLDGLTADEAGALFLSGAPQAIADLGLATVALSARAKLDATLPAELRGRAGRIRERFLLDAPGWFTHPEPLGALPACAQAVWESRRLDLRYGRPPRAMRRRVDALGLVLKAGTWYLVARHRHEVRTYRVGRVHAAEPRAETFTRPPGFDLAAWWTASSAAFDRSLLRYACRVRLSPRAQTSLPRVVPNEAVRGMLAQAGPAEAAGWRAVELELESEEVALSQLVGLGDGVEVLAPQTLRRRLAALGEGITRLNAAARAAAPPKRKKATTTRARRSDPGRIVSRRTVTRTARAARRGCSRGTAASPARAPGRAHRR